MEQTATKEKKSTKEKGGEPMPMATGSGEVVKMEVDYSAACDESLPKFQEIAKAGNLTQALTDLLALEKQTRTGGDMLSTGRVLVTIVQLCFEAKNWPLLVEHVTMLSRRRGQLKQAVVKMVQEVCNYIDALPTKELQYELINTLRNVTEGKIYVEVERARLTLKLARMKEAEGQIAEAANVLQELQVETYGSMEKKEKVELILEQMRYCLAKNDYIRTQIISKKINIKFFEDESTHELKIKYYTLMIEMDQHEASYLSICKHYRAILNTPCIQADEDKRQDVHRHVVVYLILSTYDNEQSDLLYRISEEKGLDKIPSYKRMLELFKNQELIHWGNFCTDFEAELKATDVFDQSNFGVKRWANLKNRVVEHNIRIMAKYYTRITLQRMSELLDLGSDEVEKMLCDMVVSGTVAAKVDRTAGIVFFQDSKDPNDMLNEWSYKVNNLMNLIARTTHLINKEEMVQKHLLGPAASRVTSSVPSRESVAPKPAEDGAKPMEVN